MKNLDIFKCDICGNIVQVLSTGGGELVCCGKPMNRLEPNYHEESMMEKHVPIFVDFDDNTEIRVGEVLHPMSDEHYIKFIQVISPDDKCVHLKFLNPNDIPKISLKNLPKGTVAREYCNIHGLWEGKYD